MKMLNKVLLTPLLMFTAILSGCNDNSTESSKEPIVQIISPQSNDTYKKHDLIYFEANLVLEDNVIDFDSVMWEFSNYDSVFNRNGFGKYLAVGSQNIVCTMFAGNNSYSSNINITVENIFTVDTLLQEGSFTLYQIPDDMILSLGFDGDNDIIVGTEKTGLYIKKKNMWINYSYSDGLSENSIQTISTDNNNVIYLGYYNIGGISKLDQNRISHLYKDEYYGQDIHNIIFDEENNMWVADHNGDIFKYINGEKITFPDQNVDFHHPNDFQFDKKHNLWGSSNYGAIKYDGQTWDSLFVNGKLLRSLCMTIDMDDNVWFGEDNKLYKISESDTTIYSTSLFGLPSETIRRLRTDSHNNLWIGIDKFLVKYDKTNWEVIELPVNDLRIVSLAIDVNDVVWFSASSWQSYTSVFGYYKE